ncbi:RHS repeat domain-containing protein [Gynuella sunshinyii]|uniref:Rhs family protein n=1 Tax=Gynuella sunshinyii YC6258 TaxID=1445510 RepID=A0A0C5VRS4_9GAMM|nr:RHS repeat-associated core domain-containing protein [Gynuella sunshinyii]AJQ96073.1 rhs family protein [Gynuella sunshinyii YC6258]
MSILTRTFQILSSFSVSRLMVLALYFLAAQPQAEILTTYYHNDALGSPVAATNELGKVIWKENYMPYGSKVENQDLKTNNRIGYTGHEHDPDTGLTYMQARYYDPVLGRFYAVDPVGFVETNPLSFNRYAYANNDPYKYVDPDGQLAIRAGFYKGYHGDFWLYSVRLTTSKLDYYRENSDGLSGFARLLGDTFGRILSLKNLQDKAADSIYGEQAVPAEDSDINDIIALDKKLEKFLPEKTFISQPPYHKEDIEDAIKAFKQSLSPEERKKFNKMYGSNIDEMLKKARDNNGSGSQEEDE